MISMNDDDLGFDWKSIRGFGEHDFSEFSRRIVELAPPESTLCELGVYYGRSLTQLGLLAKKANKGLRVIGIDVFDYDIPALIDRAGLKGIASFICKHSLDAAEMFDDNTFFYILLDDDHGREHIAAEIKSWMPKLERDGIMGTHDARWFTVVESCHALLDNVHHNHRDYDNILWWGKQPLQSRSIYLPTVIPQLPLAQPRHPRLDCDAQ